MGQPWGAGNLTPQLSTFFDSDTDTDCDPDADSDTETASANLTPQPSSLISHLS